MTFSMPIFLPLKQIINCNLVKNERASLVRKKASHQQLTSKEHNHTKQYSIQSEEARYLQDLGITNQQGKVLKQGQKKYKQINKYIEIIDHLISQANLPETPKIVDMGSGKGYLTFALYDYFQKIKFQACSDKRN